MATTSNPWALSRLRNTSDTTFPDVADQVTDSTKDTVEEDPDGNEKVKFTTYYNAGGEITRIGPYVMNDTPSTTSCSPSTIDSENGDTTVTITGDFSNFADADVTAFIAVPVIDKGTSFAGDLDLGPGWKVIGITTSSVNATTIVGTASVKSDQHAQIAGGTAKVIVQIGYIRTAALDITINKIP